MTTPPADVSWAKVDEILARPPVDNVPGQGEMFEAVRPAVVVAEPADIQLDLFGEVLG